MLWITLNEIIPIKWKIFFFLFISLVAYVLLFYESYTLIFCKHVVSGDLAFSYLFHGYNQSSFGSLVWSMLLFFLSFLTHSHSYTVHIGRSNNDVIFWQNFLTHLSLILSAKWALLHDGPDKLHNHRCYDMHFGVFFSCVRLMDQFIRINQNE